METISLRRGIGNEARCVLSLGLCLWDIGFVASLESVSSVSRGDFRFRQSIFRWFCYAPHARMEAGNAS